MCLLSVLASLNGSASAHEQVLANCVCGQELLQASLCILECFDFDEPKVVLMVSKKLQQLIEQENHDHDIEGLMDTPELEASKCIELSPAMEMRRNLKLCI